MAGSQRGSIFREYANSVAAGVVDAYAGKRSAILAISCTKPRLAKELDPHKRRLKVDCRLGR